MNLDIIDPDIDSLIAALRGGDCRFIYMKKDGSVREAHGTLCPELIPAADAPRGLRRPAAKVLTYYDTDRGAWRCLRRERLVGRLKV